MVVQLPTKQNICFDMYMWYYWKQINFCGKNSAVTVLPQQCCHGAQRCASTLTRKALAGAWQEENAETLERAQHAKAVQTHTELLHLSASRRVWLAGLPCFLLLFGFSLQLHSALKKTSLVCPFVRALSAHTHTRLDKCHFTSAYFIPVHFK